MEALHIQKPFQEVYEPELPFACLKITLSALEYVHHTFLSFSCSQKDVFTQLTKMCC